MRNIDRASRQTWRLIVLTVLMSLVSLGAVTLALRATAQTTASEGDPVIRDDPTVAPDAEESADNSVTFPIDI